MERADAHFVECMPIVQGIVGPITKIVYVTSSGEYPTLQELTAAEIPDTPAIPADTELVAPTSVTDKTGLQAITGAGHYSIDANIDASGAWTPIANFNGVIEGNNYTISNLTIDAAASSYQAMFVRLNTGAEIRNLNFSNCNVNGDFDVAILVARIYTGNNAIILKNLTFTNCTVQGTTGVGVVIGWADRVYNLKVYDCDVVNPTVNITEQYTAEVGGFIGGITSRGSQTETYFVRCTVQGGTINVSGNDTEDIGGFAGVLSVSDGSYATDAVVGYIFDSYSSIAVNITGSYAVIVGGFAGKMDLWNLVSSYATGDITVTVPNGGSVGAAIGGFIGQPEFFEQIVNCYATGDITVDTSGSGVANCLVYGSIGGFFGNMYTYDSQVLRCYATGNITLGGIRSCDGVGGFLGHYWNNMSSTNNIIQRCWSTGDISIADYGTITATTKGGIGGFVGLIRHTQAGKTQSLTIQDCYAWGSISYTDAETNLATGGFCGSYYTTLSMTLTFDNCYDAQTNTAAGSGLSNQIPAGNFTNGLLGYVSATTVPTVTNSFWDTDTSDIATDTYAVGHVTDWMQTKANYEAAGWDFDTIWVLTEVVGEYWQTYTNGGAVDFSGLIGETVCILADGVVYPSQVVDDNGRIDASAFSTATKVHVGLNYESKLKPMKPISQPDMMKAIVTCKQMGISVHNTDDIKYGVHDDDMKAINFDDVQWKNKCEIDGLFTGTVAVSVPDGFSVNLPLQITTSAPLPCVVRAMIPKVDQTGD